MQRGGMQVGSSYVYQVDSSSIEKSRMNCYSPGVTGSSGLIIQLFQGVSGVFYGLLLLLARRSLGEYPCKHTMLWG